MHEYFFQHKKTIVQYWNLFYQVVPYVTVYIDTSHPPGAVFQGRLLDNQEGTNSGNT